jgi:serine/threonine-protein kinase
MSIAGKFVLRELIGTGGMGQVYRSDQIGVGRTVAVKIMHRHLLGDETAAARFTNEARAASHLNHPNIISVLDFGQTEAGILYIVMEHLRGRSLDRVLLQESPIPFGRVANILCRVMDAVEAAHELNIIHRDLKPENVFLDQSTGEDFVKVLDFGVAKMLDLEDRSITTPGLVPGTPEYMSPEQARGEPLDSRSDVYSLGVILYELLTGSVPFRGSSALSTMMSHVQDTPQPPSKRRPDRNIPAPLDSVVLWALAKKVGDRISSAAEFRSILSAWAEASGLWPAEEAQRATKTNVLLQYFTKDQVKHLTSAAARVEVLPTPSPPPKLQPRSPGPPSAGGAEDEPPSHGHEAERQRLEGFLRSRAPCRVLRIQAAPGMGKARLVHAARRYAATRGMDVVHCRPSPGWANPVLGPAHRVALACLGLSRASCEPEQIRAAATGIGLDPEDLPGVEDVFGSETHLAELDPDVRRRERVTAFRHLVRRAALRKPLLVVLEEIDLYDEASREILLSLAATRGDEPLALIFTHSPTFSQLWPPHAELLDVPPLSENASAALVRSFFAGDVDAAVVDRMVRSGRGEPLFLEQIIYADANEGLSAAPEKVADLVAARVERLPQDERHLLQWLAVFGDWVARPTLAAIMGRPVDETLFSRLQERGFLQVVHHGYAFVHSLVAMVVYSSIPAEVRRQLHKAVAEYLRHIDAPPTVLAYHSYEAEEGQPAIDALERAGTSAAQALDFRAAAMHYSRALNVVRSEWGKGRIQEPELERTAVGLARRLGDALRRTGDKPAARGVLEEALSVAASDAASRAGLRLDLGRLDLDLGNLQRATRHLELARVDAASGQAGGLLGEILRELAHAVGLLQERERAGELLTESLAASRRPAARRGGSAWRDLLEAANVCVLIGLAERARGYLLDALQEADSARSAFGKLEVLSRMAEIHQTASEWDEAEMRLTQALDLVQQAGDRTRQAKLLTDLGRTYRVMGKVEEGRKALEGAMRVARTIGWWDGLRQAESEIEMLKYGAPHAL